MNEQYGKPQRPREQWPIQAPKGNKTQVHWIIAVFADEEFSLAAVDSGMATVANWTPTLPYSHLWDVLSELILYGKKYWLIAHRTKYALQQADFLGALERGDVELPRSKKKGQQHRRSGKIAYSLQTVEIDIVAGRNRIKILDWRNYGFDPAESFTHVQPIMKHVTEEFVYDFETAMAITGVRLNKTTAAQLGWQHARIDHAPPVLMYSMDLETRAMERRAYHGGRNEAYHLGDIPDAVLSLDVKSCYAAICRGCEVPVYMLEEYPQGLPFSQIDTDGPEHWIADVVLSTPTPDYPVRHNGVPIYPIGQFVTGLAWPELRHALRHGRVDRVLRAGRYRAMKAFQSYAEWYMKAREDMQASEISYMTIGIKALFNASLGYTARQKYELQPWNMDIDRRYWIGYTSAPDHSAPIVHAQVIDGVKEWLRIGGEPREAMPFLHATICSWARIGLLSIMEAAGREWVYYCDTDGILVDYRGYANLLDTPGMIGPDPGQLGERFKSGPCRIQGQKNYRIGDNIVCAGLVRTRESAWLEKTVLETPTGRVNAEGIVTPFTLRCEDQGDEKPKWVNIIA